MIKILAGILMVILAIPLLMLLAICAKYIIDIFFLCIALIISDFNSAFNTNIELKWLDNICNNIKV